MKASDVILRHAVERDAEALCKFLSALADEGLDTVSGIRPTPDEERQFIGKALTNGRAFILIALKADKIVGVLDLWAGEDVVNRHAGRIGVSVLGPYRRSGVGRRLLRAATKEAQTWPEFCRVELDVVPWNEPAIRLYESAGFLREGVKRNAIILDGKAVDLIQMALVW